MNSNLVYINEDSVRQLLDWDSVFSAVERSIIAVSKKRAVQTPRTFTEVLNTNNLLLCMPGFLKNDNNTTDTLACKLVTAFPNNEKKDPALPSVLANILLFDDLTGKLKCIIEGTEITAWRTAAASAVGTKNLHSNRDNRENNILSILGAGTQGRIHAIAFHHFFNFKEIRIWNRNADRAKQLVAELNGLKIPAIFCKQVQECVKNADVIVTATYASSPFLEREWIKDNAHINAVGAGTNHYSELSPSIYRNCVIYVDHMESAKKELSGLEEQMMVELAGEIGELITKMKPLPDSQKITVFHSLGMAVEDAAVGQIIYDKFLSEQM